MSTTFAIDPARRPSMPAPLARPELEVVAAPQVRRGRPRVVLASALVTGVGCVMAAQLLLSIGTDAEAFTAHRLQAASTSLMRQQQVQTEAIEALGAPQRLAAAADALGMVPSVSPAYLRLRDGRVLGAAVPATRAARSPLGNLTGH